MSKIFFKQSIKGFSRLVSLFFTLVLLSACAKNGSFNTLPGSGDTGSSVGQGDSSSGTSPVDPNTGAGADSGSNSGSNQNGTFSANFKPMALSWETASRPERLAWSTALYALVAKYFSTLTTAKDITTFCPKYKSLSRDQQVNAWANIIAQTTYYESGYDPTSNSVDVGTAGNLDTYSVGLLQLSVVDQPNYGFNFGYKFSDLKDPIKNLTLGMAIMQKQISKRGVIAIPTGMAGLYWAVLHPGGKYDHTAEIASKVKARISFCQ